MNIIVKILKMILCGVILMGWLSSCRSLLFYDKADEPIFSSNKVANGNSFSSDSITVATFNIKKARKIELAINEMKQLEEQTPVDIYLLQEMNETGVRDIATALGLNYLYIPIAYDGGDEKNIGNAILARGVISDPQKLILPHAKWQNRQRRAATIGEIYVHQKRMLICNVHTETIAMGRKKRMDQVDSVVSYIRREWPQYEYIIAGGDFNTAFPGYSRAVVARFHQVGLDWPTNNVGSTARAMMGLVKPMNDYLFVKGLTLQNAAAIRTFKSSDHYPVVAKFRL